MAVSPIGGIESTAKIGDHPIHPLLVPFPIALLVATLACDIIFLASGNPFWAGAAAWSLGAGVIMGAIAAVAGLTDFLGNGRIRALRDAWQHFLGNAVVLVLAFANLYMRWSAPAVDTMVVPWGVVLSAATAGLLVYTGWKGGNLVYRHRVGVGPEPVTATLDAPVTERPHRVA